MFQAPLNNVIVKVASKFLKEANRFLKEDIMNPGSQLSIADYVQIVGEVVSVPKNISNKREYNGFSTVDIRPGDTAIFSYSVIYNYTIREDGEVIFKNRVYYNGEEYFMVDIQHIYAVIRDEQIRMQNGYVMIGKMEASPLILLAPETKKLASSAQAVITHIGRCLTTEKPIDAMPGDIIFYNPNKIITYKLKEKDFGILKQSHILGKKIPDYKNFASVI